MAGGRHINLLNTNYDGAGELLCEAAAGYGHDSLQNSMCIHWNAAVALATDAPRLHQEAYEALTLNAGNGLLVQTPGVMNALLATHDSGKDAPHPHMDDFLKLYKKVQRAEKLRNTDCLPVESSPAPCVRRVAAPR